MSNITIVCHHLSGNGGIETVMVDVVNYLSQNNNINLLLTNTPENKLWLEKLNSKVKIQIPKSENKFDKAIFFIKKYILAKKNENFIILGANQLKIAYYIRKIFNKNFKIISWIHFSLKHQDMFNPQNIKYADSHLAISSAIKKEMLDYGINEENIYLIYNPINKNKLIERKTALNGVNLTYIGRIQFNDQKNIKDLLQAIENYPQKIKLDIYGTGVDNKKLIDLLANPKFSNKINYHGWTKDPWKKIKNIDAIVLTSNYEGLPMVFLEALSRGIPVISSRFDGYDDILKENKNGISYEKGNISQLVQAIQKIKNLEYNNKEIASSVDKFSLKKYLENLDEVLKKITL